MKAAQLSFRHSGKLGDVIYSLPTVKALGGGKFYINADGRELSEEAARSIVSLLQAQPYIESAELWTGQPFDVDLDAFRANNPLTTNLADAHLGAFGLNSAFRNEPWITVPALEPSGGPDVVFARTTVRPGPEEMWEQFVPRFADRAGFIGTEEEHQDFCSRFGEVRRLEVSDLLEMAQVIAQCKLVVVNQSCPYALAEALKKPAFLEVDPKQPNCIFDRTGVLAVRTQADLGRIPDHLRELDFNIEGAAASDRREQKRQFARAAFAAQEQAGYYDGANERILVRVPDDALRILDVGCAAGRLGEQLKAGRPDREVWGIEVEPEVAREAQKRLDRVLVGDVAQMDPLPLPDRYFDCVIFGDVLEHLARPEDLLTRTKAHLSKEGRILCSVPNVAHWSVITQLLRGDFRYSDRGLLDRTHLSFFTPKSFSRMLWDYGYCVHDEDSLYVPDADSLRALLDTADTLGISSKGLTETWSAYQTVFEARPHPNPYEDPEKMEILLGPHVGKLGRPEGKRCSVIVLSYNSESSIHECLDSVLATLGADDELIVVDNASADRTREILAEYESDHKACKVILNDENLGFSSGCNVGMLASRGEYLVLLNPDTRVWPNWLDRLLQRFSDPRVGAVGPLSDNVAGSQYVGFHVSCTPELPLDSLATLVSRNEIEYSAETKLLIGFCLALPRRILNSAGLLVDEMFLGSDDLELSWRLRTLGFRLLVALDVFVSHKTGISQASKPIEERCLLSLGSAQVLDLKLSAYFGSSARLKSEELWSNSIFPLR